MKLIPTILCGGAGSRLWPVSREAHPKPFIRLADGQSLLQKAFLRGAALAVAAIEMITVTNRELFFKTEDEYREVNISEDCRRRYISSRTVWPQHGASHRGGHPPRRQDPWRGCNPAGIAGGPPYPADLPAFAAAVAAAVKLASQAGSLVTFGIKPNIPETAYGYIQADGNRVVRFVEKPSLEIAKSYVESGRLSVEFRHVLLYRRRDAPRDGTAIAPRCWLPPCMLDASRTAPGKNFQQIELDAEAFEQVPDDFDRLCRDGEIGRSRWCPADWLERYRLLGCRG